MIFIYNDYGGTHTTSLAAAYHLKKIPYDRKLTKQEILNVDYFNKLTKHDFGKFIFHGKDEDGHSVYTIGRKNNKYVAPALKELTAILQQEYNLKQKIIISNTSPTVPLVMTIGGFLARGLNLNALGVPFLIQGAKQCCFQIKDLVLHTKAQSHSNDQDVIVLDNKQFK